MSFYFKDKNYVQKDEPKKEDQLIDNNNDEDNID